MAAKSPASHDMGVGREVAQQPAYAHPEQREFSRTIYGGSILERERANETRCGFLHVPSNVFFLIFVQEDERAGEDEML